MKLIIDKDNINCNKIDLLDCQVEIILKSLELASLSCDFMNFKGKEKNGEELSQMALITDTYEQILLQYNENRKIHKIKNEKIA